MAGNAGRRYVIDDRAFRRSLPRAVRELEVRGERHLLGLAIKVQNEARRLCPVDTGRLRASIHHVPGRDARGFYVQVGTNVNYAGFVEFGTRRMRAQPFLRPALARAAAWNRSP